MREEPILVVGGNVAALTAAEALSADHDVELLLPEHGLGAGFRPLEIDGRQLPLGFRVLELVVDEDHPLPSPPLREYRPDVAGHRLWLGPLDEWFRERAGAEFRQLDPPQMVVDGRWSDDIYYGVDAWPLARSLPAAERAVIAHEAREAERLLGPAGALDDDHDPWAVEMPAASVAMHGPTFHERFVQSVCAKIDPAGADGVPIALRRKLWMPLFWPTTMAEAFSGIEPGWRPTHRRFHDWGARDAVSELLRRLHASPRVQMRTAGPLRHIACDRRGITGVELADGTLREARHPLVGVSAQEAFAAAGADYEPERRRAVIAWVEAREEDVLRIPSCVISAEPYEPVFRVSTGGQAGPGTALFTVELAHSVPLEGAAPTARAGLERLGIIRPGAAARVIHAVSSLAYQAPTTENRQRWELAHEYAAPRLQGAWLLGGCGTYAADSLNEQVVQGLWAASMRKEAVAPGEVASPTVPREAART